MDAQQPPDPGAGEGHPDILENPNPFSGPFNTGKEREIISVVNKSMA